MLSPLHHSNSLALYINLYCRNVSTTSATLDNMMTSSILTRREFCQYPVFISMEYLYLELKQKM